MHPNPQPYPYSSAPTVRLTPPNTRPAYGALRPVLNLIYANCVLSVLTALITLFLHNSVLDYQLARAGLSPGATASQVDGTRNGLEIGLWIKLGSMVLLSLIYVWRTSGLKRGSKRPEIRLYYICLVGLGGVGYLIFGGEYPVWMRVEQAIQAVVLLALLFVVIREHVRSHNARKQTQSWQPKAVSIR